MALSLLVLFGVQTTGLAWTGCDHGVANTVTAAMPGMDHSDATGAEMPDAPAPTQGSGCDHRLPAGECGVGCVVAVPCTIAVALVQPALVADVFLPTSDAPLALKSAPDTPPPKA